MTIRPATPDDAGAIAQVHVEAWRTAYQSLLPAAFLATLSEEQRRSRWFEILTNSRVPEFTFVVESHGQIVGFTNGGPERTQDPELVGEIYAIYLLHEHRRHGIGTALFQRSVDFLLEHQLNSLKIWVLRDNPSRQFYEHHRGRIVAEKPITIGGTTFIETAFGWTTLEPFRSM